MVGGADPGNLSLKDVVEAGTLDKLLWRLYKNLEEGSVGRLRETFALPHSQFSLSISFL